MDYYDPCTQFEQAADRLDLAAAHARGLGRSEDELRLRALQMNVRDAIRNYRGEQSAGAFKSAFTKDFLSAS
jgi:hypothetical protein